MTQDLHNPAPKVGAATMGVGTPPQQPVGFMAPQSFSAAGVVGDVFSYLPYVYRVIENIGTIQAYVAKLQPYIAAVQANAPGLFAEGKALLNTIAPNLLQGLTPQSVQFDVSWVQKALNKAGNAGLKVDGQYGPMTHEAIRVFQEANGLTPDTWAGPLTVAKLFAQVGANP